jgi:hypothetical protein
LMELKERWRGGRCSRFGARGGMVNDRGERRKGGKSIPFTVAPLADAGRHRSDRWQPLVKPERPYRFFRPPIGRTEDLDKIQQRVLIGRTDTPSVVPSLFLLFEILLLETSPNML